MKKLILMFIFVIGVVNSYAGITMGSDIFFTTTMSYVSSNDVNNSGSGLNDFVGKSTYLYVGLIPIFSDKLIKGSANIYVQSAAAKTIYFGGAAITGMTEDKSFEATAFALSPAFSMSDPMGTGINLVAKIYTSPATKGVRFADGSTKHPVVFDDKWMNGKDYELGGTQGSGVYTKTQLVGGLFALEDFAVYNLNNFYGFGALLKLNKVDLGVVSFVIGGTGDVLKYNSSQNMIQYNKFLTFNSESRLPVQFFNENYFSAFGGFLDLGILNLVNIFGQFKMDTLGGTTTSADVPSKVGGYRIFSGVYSKAVPGSLTELDFYLNSKTTNTNATSNLAEHEMQIKLKSHGGWDLGLLGMNLFYLTEITYTAQSNTVNKFNDMENINFGTDVFTGLSGIEAKISLRYDFLYMFRLRELFRFANVDLTGSTTASLRQIESRSYVDVDLEDLTKGLWMTAGLRMQSYDFTGISTIEGNVTYLKPYVEVKYVIDDDSFVRITYGKAENYSDLAQAYGLGYDAERNTSSFGLKADNTLINDYDFNQANNHEINLEVGLKL